MHNKSNLKFAAGLLGLFAVAALTVPAAADGIYAGHLTPVQFGRDRGRGNDLPGGSWNMTCRRPDMRGSNFRAECQDARGRWRDSVIDVNTCAGNQVGNRDGNLVCEGRGGGGLPGGSWNATCRNPDMRGSRLQAECQDSRGRWRGTVLDIRTCSSNRAANRDGNLICE